MSDQKRPFHEVISKKLQAVSDRMGGDRRREDLAQVSTLLDILKQSKMPADAARQIAEDHEDLPHLLGLLFGAGISDDATVTLADLRDRDDEKESFRTEQPDTSQMY